MDLLKEYGDATKGFRAYIDRDGDILHATLWGFWSRDDGVAWKDTLAKGHGELKATGRPWHWYMNVTDYPSQSDLVQDVYRECMEDANEAGLTKTAFVVSARVLPRMQADRLSSEGGLNKQFFDSEAQALSWLKEATVAA